MYRSLFPRDLFAELDRMQRDLSGVFEPSPSIRGLGRGGYPALNVGSTPASVELYAFAPGLDPASIEVNLDRGVLTIAGERKAEAVPEKAPTSRYHATAEFAVVNQSRFFHDTTWRKAPGSTPLTVGTYFHVAALSTIASPVPVGPAMPT